jgi:hypothetical protein
MMGKYHAINPIIRVVNQFDKEYYHRIQELIEKGTAK